MNQVKPFSALRTGSLTLYLIDTWNLREAASLVRSFSGRDVYHDLVYSSYAPQFDEDGKRTRWGFYVREKGEVVGLSVLWLNPEGVAQTGADTFHHMRGTGIAPRSKAALFYLAFELLGLDRVETGCAASNTASKRSIEKAPGFEFSGVVPGRPNPDGPVEEELRYVILRETWKTFYSETKVELI